MPADPLAVAAYLTHRAEQGAAVAMARAAISAAHRQTGADDPCQHAGGDTARAPRSAHSAPHGRLPGRRVDQARAVRYRVSIGAGRISPPQ